MEKPTAEQVKAQIAALKELKPRVRHFSAFGDDNHAAIEGQLDVLEQELDRDEIYDLLDTSDHVRDAMLEARTWLDGEFTDAEDLVDSWKGLAQ